MYNKFFKLVICFCFTVLLWGCLSKDKFNFDSPIYSVTMYKVTPDGLEENIGFINIQDSPKGLKFSPSLFGMTPGKHGFHIHEFGSCQPGKNKEGKVIAALQAGGHYDSENTGRHAGPDGNGHKGDLPMLIVDKKGYANTPVYAKRLKLFEVIGKSLMIHAHEDNYSDNPPMGGCGGRIACGTIN